MDRFAWVDAGLKTLGLELDLHHGEIPLFCRPGPKDPITVAALMSKANDLFTAPLHDVLSKARGAVKETEEEAKIPGKWAVDIGTYEGGSLVTFRSVMSELPGITRDDFLKLVVDDAFLEVAKLWDQTFVEGKFTHIITKDGRVFENDGKQSVEGMPAQDVAKIMRWVFKADGLSKREIVSVYVTALEDKYVHSWYFPVKGEMFHKVSHGCVRGRLMVPCLDRGIFGPDGNIVTFEHTGTASLGGWIPAFVVGSLGKRKLLDATVSEARHFLRTFEDMRNPSSTVSQIKLKDGTTI